MRILPARGFGYARFFATTAPAAGKIRSVIIKMLYPEGIHRDAPAASLAMIAFRAARRCNPNGQYHDVEEELGKAERRATTLARTVAPSYRSPDARSALK
ncbi:MAG: hypothetical protein V4527_17850 [Pseudomonadota bacterium]